MNFILEGMTFLRYFVPLIIEGNKRGVSSKVFWCKSRKYHNPAKFIDVLKRCASEFDFQLKHIDEINKYPDITFLVEGCGLKYVNYNQKKIVLTSMRDFSVHYSKYIDKVDHVVFPSKYLADHYGTLSEKNLYLGSPKYDVKFNKDFICDKYGIPKSKVALMLLPRFSYLDANQKKKALGIYSYLKRLGYFIVVKSRAKHPAPNKWKGDRYFEDFSWFPHTTMELIYVSDIVINFDSTAIKECLMLDTPMVNFRNKPKTFFGFMYNEPCIASLKLNVNFVQFKSVVKELVDANLKDEFYHQREVFLFKPGEVSSRILEVVL